jgi:hypothetical protein
VIRRFIMHAKKTAFVVEHDFIMATYLADRVIVYEGTPSVCAKANTPVSLLSGMNKFLEVRSGTPLTAPCAWAVHTWLGRSYRGALGTRCSLLRSHSVATRRTTGHVSTRASRSWTRSRNILGTTFSWKRTTRLPGSLQPGQVQGREGAAAVAGVGEGGGKSRRLGLVQAARVK